MDTQRTSQSNEKQPFVHFICVFPLRLQVGNVRLKVFSNLFSSILEFPPGGAFGYFLGGYVPPGTPNWHPVLEKISPKIDTPF